MTESPDTHLRFASFPSFSFELVTMGLRLGYDASTLGSSHQLHLASQTLGTVPIEAENRSGGYFKASPPLVPLAHTLGSPFCIPKTWVGVEMFAAPWAGGRFTLTSLVGGS